MVIMNLIIKLRGTNETKQPITIQTVFFFSRVFTSNIAFLSHDRKEASNGYRGHLPKVDSKIILYVPEKVQVEIRRAGFSDSIASPGFLKENDKNAMEKSYSKSIVTALGQYGNSKLTYVPSDRISFVEE